MQSNNIYQHIPENLPGELFETLAQSGELKIERIVSRGHTSPTSGWYDQEHHEWVIVLQGSATISFDDGSDIILAEGDYLNIPAHRKHRVTRTSPDTDTVWLAIHYP